jgi:hypothetical protein
MRSNVRGVVAVSASGLFACAALVGLEPLGFDDAPDAPSSTPDSTADALDGSNDVRDAAFTCTDADDFCDDFERSAPVQGLWTGFGTVGSGVGGLEGGTFFADLTPQDAAAMTITTASLLLDVPWTLTDAGGRRRIRLRFRARVERCPPAGDATLTTFGLNYKDVQIVIREQVGACVAEIQEIYFYDAGAQYRRAPPILVTVGAWEDYDFELPETPPGNAGDAILRIGSVQRSLSLTTTPEATRYYHIVGLINGTYAGVDARVRYDHVRIDYLR